MTQTKFRATAEAACWKRQTCVDCGSIFRYYMTRKKQSVGPSPESAVDMAQRSVGVALRRQNEPVPCPVCGVLQPAMIGRVIMRRHLIITIATGIVLALVLLLGLSDVSLAFTTRASIGLTWIVFAIAALSALMHVAARRTNGKRETARYRARTALMLDAERVVLESAAEGFNRALRTAPGHDGGRRRIVFAALLISMAVIPLGESVRTVNTWPANDTKPIVAGPGDEITIFLPHTISCVNSLWRGAATAKVLNNQQLGLADPGLGTTVQDSSWANTIEGEVLGNRTERLRLAVAIPDGEQLTGQRMQLRTHIDVTYPTKVNASSFNEVEEAYTDDIELHLAPPRAGTLYSTLFLGGMVGGSVLVTLMGVAFRSLALRTVRASDQATLIPIEADPPLMV